MSWHFVMSANETVGKKSEDESRQLNGFFENKRGIFISLYNDEFAVLFNQATNKV